MSNNKFFNALVYGAAATLGSVITSKGIKVLTDPNKRAKIKNGFKNIKEAFTK